MTNASRLPVSEAQSRCVDIIGDKKPVGPISETTSANMLPVRYTFVPLRAPLLSKLEGHVPLLGIWLRRLCFEGDEDLRRHSG